MLEDKIGRNGSMAGRLEAQPRAGSRPLERLACFAVLGGRILLAQIFILAALNKLASFGQTTEYMASKGIPIAASFLLGAILLELAGGLSVLLGYRARFGAAALLLFLIPTTLVFHNFWALSGMESQVQMTMFMKNLSIMGGLLIVFGLGAGPLSLDSRRGRD